jgi:hypothetical protein
MTPLRAFLVGAAVAALTTVAAPAVAMTETVSDASGDAAGRGLDVTRVVVRNDDRRIVVRTSFVEAVRGDLIVSIDPRGARGVRLVSQHRPAGTTRNSVLPYAFSDVATERAARCQGFRVRWDLAAETARMVLPSTCLRGGDYGAIRFAVLTERGGSGDTDFAPETAHGDIGVSSWVPRG